MNGWLIAKNDERVAGMLACVHDDNGTISRGLLEVVKAGR